MSAAGILSLAVLVFGGVGLFLIGMSFMTDGLKALAGERLRTILSAWTRTALRGLLAGMGLTALVQSSSAVVVATIGFVNSGLLTLREAVWVVFGTNIGTTATGWIVALVGVKIELQPLALALIGAGAALRLLGKGEGASAAAGMTLAGFGLFFLGIELLKEGFAGIGAGLDPGALDRDGWGGRLIFLGLGVALTVLTQSSSAGIAVVLTAVAGGGIPVDLAAMAIIGANLGTTSTAVLAAIGAQPAARRVAASHVVFNLITAGVSVLVLGPILDAVSSIAAALDRDPDVPTLLALFNTAFNLLGVLLMVPLARPLVAFLERRFTTDEEQVARPAHVDETVLTIPEVALSGLALDIRRLGDFAVEMGDRAIAAGHGSSAWLRSRRLAVQRLATALYDFMARLSARGMPEAAAVALSHQLRAIQHFEEMAELAAGQVGGYSVDEKAPVLADLAAYDAMARERLKAIWGESGESNAVERALARAAEVGDAYQTMKTRLLHAAATGEISVNALDALTDRINAGRRIVEHAAKAVRRLALAAEASERRTATPLEETTPPDAPGPG
jgi:phosphate:Na+ symporter